MKMYHKTGLSEWFLAWSLTLKELALRSNGAIRVGSTPTARTSANSSVVEFNSSKVETWVRFPLGASVFDVTLL